MMPYNSSYGLKSTSTSDSCAYQLLYLILLGSYLEPITDAPEKAIQSSNFLGLAEGYTKSLLQLWENYVVFFVNVLFLV